MLKKILLVAALSFCATAQAQPVSETVPMLGLSMAFDQQHVKHYKTPHWQAGLMQRHTVSGEWRSLAGFSYRSTTGLHSTLMGIDMAAWRSIATESSSLAESTLGAIIFGAGAVAIAAAATNFDDDEEEKKFDSCERDRIEATAIACAESCCDAF